MTPKPETKQPIKRYCAYCEKEINGRSEKIYCNVNCKNNFNARIIAEKRQKENQVFPRTIAQLKKNYRILAGYNLQDLEPGKTINVHIDELKKQGFDYRFCTGAYSSYKNEPLLYCFDYGWIKNGNWITLSYAPDICERW